MIDTPRDPLADWLRTRRTTTWSTGFSKEFHRGYDTAVEEAQAAFDARPSGDEALRAAIIEIVAAHSSGEYARYGGDALLRDIRDALLAAPVSPSPDVDPGLADIAGHICPTCKRSASRLKRETPHA